MKREVLSAPKPPRAVHGRVSQFDTQPDPPALEPRPAWTDSVVLPLPDDAPGCPVADPLALPGLTVSSYRGTLPPLAPVSGPAPSVQVVNSDIFARARVAAVQSRVAAPVVSGPRAPGKRGNDHDLLDVSGRKRLLATWSDA